MNLNIGKDWSEAEARQLHARLLAEKARVAAAESLTVGRVQALLGKVSGSSAYFVGGLAAYSSEVKTRLLGVDPAHAAEVNAVSARVAEEMARGACKLFHADIGVATTGYAEPDAARRVTEPMAWVAVAWGGEVRVARVDGAGLGREAMQAKSAAEALRLLAAWLEVRDTA
jgi:nicotinamide-nucleotide amidase